MTLKTPSRKVLLLVLLAMLFLWALVFIFQRAGPLAPVRVTVVQATEGRIMPAIFGIGTVEARLSYLIGPTSAGRVVRVLVDVGDVVKAGQLLAEMDPVDMDSRLMALDASLARGASAITVSQAQLADAQAREKLADLNLRRYSELGQQNFMSTGAVEAKVQEFSSADASLKAAQANLLATRQDLTRLTAERVALVQQRQNMRLLATHDSTVVSRDAESGSTVVAGQAVLKLVDTRSLWVKARFDQGRSGGLAAGLLAQVVLRASAGQTRSAHVVRVDLQSDSVTEERIAQVAFDSLPAGLSVGELAEVTLQLPPGEPGLLLPNGSIKRLDGQTGVWVLLGNVPKFVPIRIGQSSLDGLVQVLLGLRSGDRVVVYSEKEIHAHSRIQVVDSLLAPPP